MRTSVVVHCAVAVGAAAIIACREMPTASPASESGARPVLLQDGRTYVQVTAGFVHTCALDSSGAAVCWGNNDYGQLGATSNASACGGRPCSKTPLLVSGALRFTRLAAGWVANCGIATDHRTYCWGGGANDGKGYLGDGSLQRSLAPVQVVADSAFESVTMGDGHACALTATGVAFCWGQNDRGQLGDGTTQDRPTPVAVSTNLRFTKLSAGAYHVCGITTGGDAYCWGDNRWGELGTGDVSYNATGASRLVPTAVTGGLKFSAVASGWEHSCAIATSGAAYCWGRNDDARQLGDDTPVTHRGTPAAVTGSYHFVSLSAGALSTCGRTDANEVYCWGGNYYGALGNGETDAAGVGHPVHTLGGPFATVTIGQAHACGIGSDDRLWCWGDQSAGQY